MGYCKVLRNGNSTGEGGVPKHVICMTHESELFSLASDMPQSGGSSRSTHCHRLDYTVAVMDISVLQERSWSNTGRVKLHHKWFSLSIRSTDSSFASEEMSVKTGEICRKLSTRSNLSFSRQSLVCHNTAGNSHCTSRHLEDKGSKPYVRLKRTGICRK